jgi:hypothetical protein
VRPEGLGKLIQINFSHWLAEGFSGKDEGGYTSLIGSLQGLQSKTKAAAPLSLAGCRVLRVRRTRLHLSHWLAAGFGA